MKRITPRQHVLGIGPDGPGFAHWVYLLYCPLEKRICYVGYTRGRPYYRLQQHINEANFYSNGGGSSKIKWLRKLKELGLKPFMWPVKGFSDKEEAKRFEANLIRHVAQRRRLYNADMGAAKYFA